ncbi:Hypothetical predicted protein, partial [Mytilus galloprovincialis]
MVTWWNSFDTKIRRIPPSLSQFGELRHGSKSDLLVQLERITESVNEAPRVDALVIDGAALINMLKPRGSNTFDSYCKDIVVPYIRGQLLSVRRIDMRSRSNLLEKDFQLSSYLWCARFVTKNKEKFLFISVVRQSRATVVYIANYN